ncbi:iron ABC transporter permease [candidate division KSB1 bacterium]|nr:iron ABC transporter permease [candidate division KSB1 bacterium]
MNWLSRYDLTPWRLISLVFLLVFFGLFLIYPLIFVFRNAFYVDGKFTFTFFRLMFQDPNQWEVVLNSINLAFMVTFLTTLLTLPLAFIMVRYAIPGKTLLNSLILIPMVLPPFVGAIGMRQVFSRFGSINLFLMNAGIIQQPIDWFGTGEIYGVVVMQVLHLYPIMYLNVAAALANIDPAMEEAARNVGAHGWTLFRKITFPLMLPGYFAGASLVFIWSFTDLGTPLIFEYRQLVPVQIFDMLSNIHENPMGYVLVVVMILMSLGYFLLTRSFVAGQRFEMLGHGRVGRIPQKASSRITFIFYIVFLGLTLLALIPHLSVILMAISKRWFMTIVPEQYTWQYLGMIFQHHVTTIGIRNSFFLSTLSTLVDIIAGIGIAYFLTRTKIPGRNLLDALSMLPLALPGIVLAYGYLAGFSGTMLDARQNPIPLLICAYAIRRLPYMVRSAYAGFQQISISLEEAAQNVGASPSRALMRITLPLIVANLIAGGVLSFAFAMLEVSDSLILAAEQKYYPITKALYELLGRPDGPFIASALGLLGMLILSISLILAGKFLGKRLGELFRI